MVVTCAIVCVCVCVCARQARAARSDRRSRLIGRFLDFFPIISDPRFLSVTCIGDREIFLCVCTSNSIHEKYK